MTDTQNEVFKTPVNKIRLFEHGAPGSQNFKLTRKYYTEDMPDGRVKHIVQNITDPDIVPYIPDGIGNSTDRQRIPAVLIIPEVRSDALYTTLKVKMLQSGLIVWE